MIKIYSIVLMFLFTLALHGWGSLVLAWCHGRERPFRFAYPVVMGMAIWIFLGAFLQIMRLATGWMIDLMVVVGLGMAVWLTLLPAYRVKGLAGLARLPLRSRRRDIWKELSYSVIACTALFLFIYLTPELSFNYGDDLDTYFNIVVGLINYGTLTGQPFHSVGNSAVGGMAFLQGFFAAHLPIAYVGTLDHVFAPILGLILLKEIAEEFEVPSHSLLGAMLLFLVINPQIVNVSVVYTGAVVVMGMSLAAIRLFTTLETAILRQQLLASVPVALFAGALLPLKFTFVTFIVIFLIISIIILFKRSLSVRDAALIVFLGAGIMVMESLAWSMPFQDKLAILMGGSGVGSNEPSNSLTFNLVRYTVFLFQNNQLFYGGQPIYYTLIVLMLFGIVIWSWWILRRDNGHRGVAVVLLATCSASFASYFLMGPIAGRIDDMGTAIRYAIPNLLGIAPVAIILVQILTKNKIKNIIINCILVIICISFGDTLIKRIATSVKYNHCISFPVASNTEYRKGIQTVLDVSFKEEMRRIQAHVPPGKTILAVTPSTFHLDFERNPIKIADTGINNKNITSDSSTEDVRQLFLKAGIHSLILKFRGFGVKDIQYFKRLINSINPDTQIWYTSIIRILTAMIELNKLFAHKIIGDFVVIDLTTPL
ncbi:MAG: hypothetical protein HQM03_04725 [Magnetococcales bacterium]|nr:hypothetical protein [Magnetococcales bacterium]